MSNPDELVDGASEILESISEHVTSSGWRVAVAESLTAGTIATHLGAAPSSSDWFAGGVVAYTNDAKYSVLGVDDGPVVTAAAAEQMARGVARLLGADVAVSVTGVGGPEPEEDQPVGTVFVGVHTAEGSACEEHHFDGEVGDILAATTLVALRLLGEQLDRRA